MSASMLQALDPFASSGSWLVGSDGNVIDQFTTDAREVLVTRVAIDRATRTPAQTHVELRRVGEPLRVVVATAHVTASRSAQPGIRVGAEMCLTLRPLGDPNGVVVRRTAPVLWIAREVGSVGATSKRVTRHAPWSTLARRAARRQPQLVAASEAWLAWCSANGVDPLSPSMADLERAANDLRAAKADRQDVLDLLDQVGAMTGLWREAAWRAMRRTI